MTSGKDGSHFRIDSGFDFVPAFPVETVDATGCGDAFIGGLLSRLVVDSEWRSGKDTRAFRSHLMYANAVGAITATTQGVIPALPNAADVTNFLDQQAEWRETNE
jgi:sugar/nucleoside kinase (ribokinase family)